ncbi:UTP--glucose-1-phosphate uridylyltransferase [Fundicoccus culcitae]|uniref:UTP--glucose-1-phosphate uridylyltransferase n=1 Tax=Fundicoccus culcitae TaxID=2969821 RepID=A0ABY5P208_9LACT|nr:UTP--glucose-1-phosphate uridylyltransferase [Fundicoccus culcitae]UUX32738.1 UTP--glucose-1-phosphate uridylyltransferase [Fundicoccus culcitae]
MSKVRKAIIPAAGYGTGFLPATKASPKELLPIVDKPIIQFIVEEAMASGIEEIIIVTGKHKRSIEDHFDSAIELESNLLEKEKWDLLELVKDTTMPNLFFVRQSYPLGLGDAIYQAKAFVSNEPFVVMLGDNIIDAEIPVTKQLIDLYDETQQMNVAVIETPEKDLSKYGNVDKGTLLPQFGHGDDVIKVNNFIEKPTKENILSSYAIAGRYVLTPEIFDVLANQEPGIDDKIQLTDALQKISQYQTVYARIVDADRHDVGNKLGYLQYSLEYGLEHPEIADGLRDLIIKKSQDLK